MEQVQKCLIKSPQATKPSRHRNFGHRHLRLMDKLFRKEHPPGNYNSASELPKPPQELAALWEERRAQLLMDLSLNLKAVISQRLMKKVDGKGRVAAIEILMNSPLISDLILKGEVHGIKEIMAKSNELGMNTFDQALFDLYEADLISFDDAIRNADSQNELRLRIKLEGKAARGRNPLEDAVGLRLEETEQETGFLR